MSPARAALLVAAAIAAAPLLAAAASSAAAQNAAQGSAAQDAAEKDPGPIAHYQRGVAALQAKKPEDAKKELALASAGLPDEPDILSALAKAEALTGDSQAALKSLSRVVAMGYGVGAENEKTQSVVCAQVDSDARYFRVAAETPP